MKLSKLILWGFFSVAAMLPATATAADKAGEVASVSGRSEVGREGSWRPLWKGDPVFVGDLVRTGADGRVQVQMVDKSVISVSANSRLEITSYLFKAGGERKSLLRLWTGKLRAVVSKYSGSGGNDYRLSTPTAVAGVRGTDLVLDIQPADPENPPEESPSENPEGYATTLAVLEGEVEFQNILEGIAGQVVVTGGNLSRIQHGNAPEGVRQMNSQERSRYQSASFAPRNSGPQFAGGEGGGLPQQSGNEGGNEAGNEGDSEGESEEGSEGNESGENTPGGEGSGNDLGQALGEGIAPPTPPINQEPGTVDGLVPVTVEIRRVD
jgi:hypothetical protein